ncbi:MAG: protein tyrosine phosphatase [Prevotella sp.]
MSKIKITREEAQRRWNSALETKRRMTERLETMARESYKEQTGEYPAGVEIW